MHGRSVRGELVLRDEFVTFPAGLADDRSGKSISNSDHRVSFLLRIPGDYFVPNFRSHRAVLLKICDDGKATGTETRLIPARGLPALWNHGRFFVLTVCIPTSY